jgi:hypothetical protein
MVAAGEDFRTAGQPVENRQTFARLCKRDLSPIRKGGAHKTCGG